MFSYSALSDHELLVLITEEDHNAYTELFDRYWKKMLQVAYNKIRDMDEAEEIVQDIFVSLWCRRHQLGTIVSINNYLASAVKYQVIKVMAKENLRKKYLEYQSKSHLEAGINTPDWLSFEELGTRLGQLVADLPETSRLVYQMSKEKGYTQKQIALELNITERAVENRLRRAMKSIRTGLNHLLFFLF